MTRTRTHSVPKRNLGWFALILVPCLACGAYLNTLSNGFVLDDGRWLAAAQQLKAGAPPNTVFVQPSSRDEDGTMTYRPFAVLSLALDYGWWRQNALGYHQTSVLLHVVAALLVLGCVFLLTRNTKTAGIVAVLFAVHPLATGCVSYVANRGELLAAVGVLTALGLLIATKGWSITPNVAAGIASLVAFWVAVGSGEIALIGPVLAAAYLIAFEPGAKRRWAWVGLLAVLALIYMVVRYRVLGGWGLPAERFNVAQQVVLFFRAIGASVITLVWPLRLKLEHSLTLSRASVLWFEFLLGIAVFPATLFLLARARGGLPEAWFGTVWAVAGIVPPALLAGRTGKLVESALYLPSVGVWLAVVALARHFVRRNPAISQHGKVLMALGCVIIAGLFLRTMNRNKDWQNELKLLAEALVNEPNSAELHLRFGGALERNGAKLLAIDQYRDATRLQPNDPRAHTALAVAFGDSGSLTEATVHFREALRCDPNNPQAHYNLAIALSKQGETGEAIAQYIAALSGPEQPLDAANNLAWLLATTPRAEFRNGAQAVEIASRLAQMTGAEQPEILDTLAAALAETGNFPEASRVAQQAAQLADSRGDSDTAATIRSRLKLYLAGKPYHQPGESH